MFSVCGLQHMLFADTSVLCSALLTLFQFCLVHFLNQCCMQGWCDVCCLCFYSRIDNRMRCEIRSMEYLRSGCMLETPWGICRVNKRCEISILLMRKQCVSLHLSGETWKFKLIFAIWHILLHTKREFEMWIVLCRKSNTFLVEISPVSEVRGQYFANKLRILCD